MELIYKGISLEVTYESIPAYHGARDSCGGVAGAGPPLEPDEDAGIEIQTVEHRGEDITALLSDEAFAEIEELIIKGLED